MEGDGMVKGDWEDPLVLSFASGPSSTLLALGGQEAGAEPGADKIASAAAGLTSMLEGLKREDEDFEDDEDEEEDDEEEEGPVLVCSFTLGGPRVVIESKEEEKRRKEQRVKVKEEVDDDDDDEEEEDEEDVEEVNLEGSAIQSTLVIQLPGSGPAPRIAILDGPDVTKIIDNNNTKEPAKEETVVKEAKKEKKEKKSVFGCLPCFGGRNCFPCFLPKRKGGKRSKEGEETVEKEAKKEKKSVFGCLPCFGGRNCFPCFLPKRRKPSGGGD